MTSKLSQIGQILFKDFNHYPKSEHESCLRMAKRILKQRDTIPSWRTTYIAGVFTWVWATIIMCIMHITSLIDTESEIELTLCDWVVLPIGFAIFASIVLTIAERASVICARQPEYDWAEKYRSELKMD